MSKNKKWKTNEHSVSMWRHQKDVDVTRQW